MLPTSSFVESENNTRFLRKNGRLLPFMDVYGLPYSLTSPRVPQLIYKNVLSVFL